MKRLTVMIGDALADAHDNRAAATELIDERIEELARAGDPEAEADSARARQRGWRVSIDHFCRTAVGRLVTGRNGHSATIPAGKSAHRRSATGEVEQLYLPMVDMLFDELRFKLQECGRQGDKLLKTVAAISRLLTLQKRVPDAKTPQQALTDLGLSLDQWLADSKAGT